ncbi:hypothetical protein GCM10009111_05810 [Colwellia asteriadis]|uniref:CvpA family protein n=1 Tax=Colwellia asteriadis TaxID=517723 RepID=A0ABN1L3J9_9GAMM
MVWDVLGYSLVTIIVLFVVYYLFERKLEAVGRFFSNKAKRFSGFLLIVALLLYFIWFMFVLIRANEIFIDSTVFDAAFPGRLNTESINFWKSVASSTLDSLVFLILISSVFALRSLRDPKEDDYKRKIQNLFPEIDMSSDIGLYLQKKISFLACISPNVHRVLTIDKLSDCEQFIHLSVQTDCDIKNIHHNHPFSDELRYKVKPDEFEFDSDYIIKVLKMQVIKHRNGKDNKSKVLPHAVAIRSSDENREFDQSLQLQLAPYETATYLTHSLMWQDLSKPFNSSNVRYTIEQNYEIKNDTKMDLYLKLIKPINRTFADRIKELFRINVDDKKERLVTLKVGDIHKFTTGEVEPGEKVSVLFSKEQFQKEE